MAAAPTALDRTSTDTLVTGFGLHHSVGQITLAAAGTGVIPPPETLLGLDYVLAYAEIAELLDARLARS
jgi:hypothetical protein